MNLSRLDIRYISDVEELKEFNFLEGLSFGQKKISEIDGLEIFAANLQELHLIENWVPEIRDPCHTLP